MADRLRKRIDAVEKRTVTQRDADIEITSLDVQLLLTAALLPTNSVTRRRVADAFRRMETVTHSHKRQTTAMKEEEMRPVHIPIGKGASVVIWAPR